MIRLRALGGLAVEIDGGIPSGAAAQRVPLCLLAVLACAGDAGVSRNELAALLWPDATAGEARSALKQVILALRHDLDAPELFQRTKDRVRLNAACITSDVGELRRAAEREDSEGVVAAFGGPLLAGVDHCGGPALRELIDAHRAEIDTVFMASVEEAARAARASGDGRREVQFWRRLAAHEPFNGRFALGLIHALAAAQDRTGALQFARVYETLIREELGESPDPDVVASAEALRRGESLGPRKPKLNLAANGSSGQVASRLASGAGTASIADDEQVSASPRRPTGGRLEAEPFAPYQFGEETEVEEQGRSSMRRPRGWWGGGRLRRALILGTVLIGPVFVATILTAADADSEKEAASLSEHRIAVVPCDGSPSSRSDGAFVDARECDALIEHALRRWTDIEVVDPLLMNDRIQRVGARTHAERLELARELGAGHAILARVSDIQGGSVIHASLHNVESGRQVRAYSVSIPASFEDMTPSMHELLGNLLAESRGTGPDAPSPLGTHRLAAWRALERGNTALGSWDLRAASRAFERALDEDSTYAQAAYWLAQVEHWLNDAPEAVLSGMAARALALSEALPERERAQARALAHLTQRSFPEACTGYDRLIAADSANIIAWLGRADCHARDQGVLPDPSSRTGWRFRSSRKAAMESYTRAFSMAPSAFRIYAMPRFDRIRAVYPTSANNAVLGIAVGDPAQRFVAFPELHADSIALTPIPLDPMRGIPDTVVVPGRKVAAQRSARLLRDLTTIWAEGDKSNPAAHEAHALALEGNGEVIATLSGHDALWHVRRASSLMAEGGGVADTSAGSLRLKVAEVRLLVKRGAYAEAHDSASTLLAVAPALSSAGARVVAPIAALLGRSGELEYLIERARPVADAVRPELANVPGLQPAMVAQELLLVALTSGMPRDTIAARYRRLEHLIDLNVPEEEQGRVRALLLSEVFHIGLFELPAGVERGFPQIDLPLLKAQLHLRNSDPTAAAPVVRAKMAQLRANPGDSWPSAWLVAARMALAIGDSTAAVEMLDRGLAALPRVPANVMSRPHAAAAIPELAAMRGRLRGVGGADSDARRWTEAASALRRTADVTMRSPAVR